jgi:aryl-alcohol dehydrogenase-like predicted oxidoreductase
MEQRLLGRSGLSVSALSFGSMTIGRKARFAHMGSLGVPETARMINLCQDAGVTLIDTADVYSLGGAEEVLGEVLQGRRHQFVICSKVFFRIGPGPHDVGLSRKHILEACEASLRRLRTDYIDLYLSHDPDLLTPVEETLGAYDDLVRQGKVRYIGCSNFSGWQLMKSLALSERYGLPRYICQQTNYSLLARDVEHELIPLGLDQGVGVMVWSPFHGGLLSGKFRRAAIRATRSWSSTRPTLECGLSAALLLRLRLGSNLLCPIPKPHRTCSARLSSNWDCACKR